MQNPLYKKVLKYNTQVPRYTSYPTAPHFSEVVTSSVYSSWLRGIPEDATISLYLHIPFCKKLCWYCGCRTQMTNRYAPVEDYVHLLKREIRLISNVLQNNQRHVLHIHFGGGSPTLLLPEDFVLLMEEIRKHFVVDVLHIPMQTWIRIWMTITVCCTVCGSETLTQETRDQ